MLTGNKGEWSELYVLLKLLAEGRLYAADDEVKRIEDMYFPILSIYRKESQDKYVEYDIPTDNPADEFQYITIHLNDEAVATVDRSRLSDEAKILYDRIIQGGDRAFAIPDMDDIMRTLLCERLAAPSHDKTDITLHIHDIQTGFDQLSGFSIKSELGSAPTLLNASKATNFIYRVEGITDADMEMINSFSNPRSKILDRISKIMEIGDMSYEGMASRKFANNLLFIDTEMDRLIAEALLIHYTENESSCEKVIQRLEENNPLEISRAGFYEFKFKKFLCSVALGMVPSREWDGMDESNGGYIIVNKDGDVLAYHIYNRDNFETYLLKNTKFERASTTRHDYASVYKGNDGKKYINLNLQIRF